LAQLLIPLAVATYRAKKEHPFTLIVTASAFVAINQSINIFE
jgi:hypothetical protein